MESTEANKDINATNRPQGRTNYFLLGEVEVLTHNYKSQRLN